MNTATYELTREDLAALIYHHQAASPAITRYRSIRLGVIVCLFMALPLLILATSKKPLLQTAMDIWPLLVIPVCFAVVVLPYVRWRTRQITNRLLNDGKNTGFYGHCELTVCDDGLTETRPSGSTNRIWSSVERIVTTPSHLFIYTSGIEAFVVPRRAFASDAEFSSFTDSVAQRSGMNVQNYR